MDPEKMLSAFGSAIDATVRPAENAVPPAARRDVAKRLEKHFSLGERPAIRLKLFAAIDRAVEKFGEPAYQIVAECVQDAASKEHPARWFCKVCTSRLVQAGLIGGKPPKKVDW